MSEEAGTEGVEVPVEEQDEAVELAALAVDDGKGGKHVPLSALIGSKKTARDLQKQLKDTTAQLTEANKVYTQLQGAQPIIDAILSSPKLKAEALRIAQGGTRQTAETTEQPDDADLASYAEDSGFYLADGVTPDAARAGRVLSLLERRHGKQTDQRIAPLAGLTLNRQAQGNLNQAIAATDDDGVALATRESIMEVAKELPAQLLADPRVVELVLNSAIGKDKRMKRTPKPVDEPLYMERNNGGGGSRTPALDASERSFLKTTGISEERYKKNSAKLEAGVANRCGIVLGED